MISPWTLASRETDQVNNFHGSLALTASAKSHSGLFAGFDDVLSHLCLHLCRPSVAVASGLQQKLAC